MSIMLIFTMLPYVSFANFSADAATKSFDASSIVKEAENYIGLGLKNTQKRMISLHGKTWRSNYEGDWCAWFVSACAYNVNSSEFPGMGTYPEDIANAVLKQGGTVTFVSKKWYETKTKWTGKESFGIKTSSGDVRLNTSYKPRKGDFVILCNNDPNYFAHVGIVAENSNSTSSVKVIDGNGGPNHWSVTKVQKRTIGSDIVAYVTPQYGISSGSGSGSSLSSQQDYINKYGNAARIFVYLVNKGLSRNGAYGVLGNIQAESGFRPGIEEYSTGIGYGICQWSFGRRTNLESYAKQIGKKVSDLGLQCDFLWKELNYSRYSNLLSLLKSSTITSSEAADKFVRIFEIPANIDSTSLRRQQFAREWESKLKNMPICNGHTCVKASSIKSGVCDNCKEPYTNWDVNVDKKIWDTSSSVVSSSSRWYKVKTGTIGVRLRKYPDENSNSALETTDGGSTEAVRINNGQGVQVLAKNKNGWYKVKAKNGKLGYINEKYISVFTPADTGESTLTATLSNKTVTKLSKGRSAIVHGSVSSNYPLKQVTIKYKKGDVIKRFGKSFDNYSYTRIILNDTWAFVNDANMKNLGAGAWDIYIYARDVSGKEFEKKLGNVVISDPEVKLPTIEKIGIEGGYKIKVTNNEGGDLYVVIDKGKINKSSKNTYTANITEDGKHTVKAYVWANGKRSANIEKSVSVGVTSDPTINISQANGKAAVTFTPADSKDTVMYKIGSSTKYQKYDGSVLEVSDGAKVEAYAIGIGCRKSAVVSETVDMTAPDAPDAKLISSETIVPEGDPITVGWSNDSNASSYKVRLLKGGSLVEEVTTKETTATFTLAVSGEYTVEVTATNDVGSGDVTTFKVTAVKPLDVTFMDADDGSGQNVIAALQVKYGETPESIVAPTREGYDFVGWNSSITGETSTNAYLNRPVTENITYTAEYSKKQYTVKFYDVNGDVIDTRSVAYGEAVVAPDVTLTSGEVFMGWNVIKVSDEHSRADISFVDCDMTLQAVTKWGNEDLPVNIEWVSAELKNGNSTVDPVLTITADKEREQNIYLILALKASVDGVDKTLYVDRQKFTIPLGENTVKIGGDDSSYSFELKPSANLDMSTVEKIEAYAVECRDDGSTGGTESQVAVIEGLNYPSTRGEQNLEYRPEEKEGRIITEKTQYRTITTETAHSSSDTLEGYVNTGKTEYYDRDNGTWSSEPVYTWSNWASSKPSLTPEDAGTYTKISECNDDDSSMHQKAYRALTYFCDCRKTFTFSSKSTCSKCGGKTTNTLVLYTEKPLSNLSSKNSDGSYTGDKTIKLSVVGKVGVKYVMYENGKYVTEFTSNASHTYLWESTAYPGKSADVYRKRSYRPGTLFTRDIIGEWTESQPTSGDYETRTVYDYMDIVPDAGSGNVEGVTRHFPDTTLGETGVIDSAEDLSGKTATVMIYQSKNFDPNSYQVQYVGQTTIGSGNYVDFDYSLKNEPNYDTGNYIVSLGIEGSTGLVTVGRVEAPKKTCYVKFYYTEPDGTNTYIVGNASDNYDALEVKENSDVNISELFIPYREGYYFAGFDKSTTNITSDTTIKVLYRPVMNAIVYVDWVNKNVNIEKGLTGDKCTLPGALEDSEGYKFKGWKLPDGTVKNPGEEFEITGDMVISAEFDQEEYNVRFIAPDGTVIDSQIVKYGEAAVPPEYTPAEGTFVSWNTSVNWWKVEGDVDVYPVIVYDEEALSPKARVTYSDAGERQVEIDFADTDVDNKIYYTTDGTVPTGEMIAEYLNAKPEEYHGSINEYTGPITPEEDANILAVGYEEGKNESEVAFLYFEKEPDASVSNDIDSPFKTVSASTVGDGWVELGTFDAKVRAGKNVMVTVSLDENPGLAGYDFLVECDSGVLLADRDEYDDPVAEAGEVSLNGTLNTSETGDGYRMLWYGDETVTGKGTLFNMTLHADEEAEDGIYPVTVYYAPENTVDEYDEVELTGVNIKVESEAAVDISTLDIRLSRDSFVYEGTAIEPAVSIQGLKEGEDYEVYYEDNTNVGTAKVVVCGEGDYVGTAEKEFSITQANIINAELVNIPPQKYTGKAIEPELDLSYNGVNLEEGTDYTVSFTGNSKVGTATVSIKGIGNFKGTMQSQFEITSDGEPAKTGWINEDGYWYFYDENGYMVTSTWRKDSKGWCYLGDDGKMVTNGWAKDSKGYCWIGPAGYMIEKTQWIKHDGSWYHITKGYRDESKWMKDSKGWCWLQADGRMLTNGWAKDSIGWCWIASNGYMPTTTQWIQYDGSWYHITKGYRDQSKWMKDSQGWCWLQADGRMLTNGWAKDSIGWCWIAANGYMPTTTQWVKYDGGWYYIEKGYRVQNAWRKDSKGWCYLGPEGRMVTNDFVKDSKGWCWIGPDGYMEEVDKWIGEAGAVGSSYIIAGYRVDGKTITIDGVQYTFDKDGKLVG